MKNNTSEAISQNFSLDRNKNMELFMTAFLFELEIKMNDNLSFFDGLVLQMDEANTDQLLKEKIRDFVNRFSNKVTQINEISIGNEVVSIETAYIIENVKTASEIDETERAIIKNKGKAVFTNPDLVFFVGYNNYKELISIEVKSTKNDNIPGSSIQQIRPNDWVIFCKHKDGNITEFSTGKYINSINGTMQFPDRSPRPQVSYNTLKKWNSNYRNVSESRLEIIIDEKMRDKLRLLDDWQQVLSLRWLDVLKTNKKNTEPWFNNNLRKFAVMFLDYYEDLNEIEKENFKRQIAENIEDNENE